MKGRKKAICTILEVLGLIVFVALFFLVGGCEQDMITLRECVIWGALLIVALFTIFIVHNHLK